MPFLDNFPVIAVLYAMRSSGVPKLFLDRRGTNFTIKELLSKNGWFFVIKAFKTSKNR